jgi:hypothetical protein
MHGAQALTDNPVIESMSTLRCNPILWLLHMQLLVGVAGTPKPLGKEVDVVVSNRLFRWVNTMLTWDAAQANCKKLGGVLAVADNNGISSTLASHYAKGLSDWVFPSLSPGAWIGLRTASGLYDPPRKWEWVAVTAGRMQNGDFLAFRSGSPAGFPPGGCALMKPAELDYRYGFAEWLGYPCNSTLAPSWCEL